MSQKVTVKGLGRSSAYVGVAQAWRIGSRILLTPLIIAKLGLDGYGTWTLLFSICAYVSVLNVGFGVAYSKFTAEYDRKRDYQTLSQIIGSGMVAVGMVAVLALCVIWVLHGPILQALNVPGHMLSDAGTALLIVALCLLLRMSFGCVFQILAGLQRIDLQYKMTIVASAVEFGVTIWLLVQGHGLLALAIGHACGQVLATAVAWVLCKRLCPALSISPLRVSRSGLRHVLSLGGRFQMLSFLVTFLTQGRKLLISALCGVEALAVFELAIKLLTIASTAGDAIIAPMMPAFANLHASQDHRRWRELYERGTRILSAVCVAAFAFVALFADRLIMLWTGQEYPLAAWTIRVLVATHLLSMVGGMATASLRSRGTVRLEMWCLIIEILVFVALAIPGYLLAGYQGIVVAFACCLVGTVWLMVAFARQESLSVIDYFRDVLVRPVLAGLPVIVSTIFLRIYGDLSVSWIGGRGGLALELSLWGWAYLVAIGLLMWWVVFSQEDKRSLAELVSVGRRRAATLERDSAGK